MRKKRWMSIMLVLCMILTLLPINTAYADEVMKNSEKIV